jgi:hypothetical protein
MERTKGEILVCVLRFTSTYHFTPSTLFYCVQIFTYLLSRLFLHWSGKTYSTSDITTKRIVSIGALRHEIHEKDI